MSTARILCSVSSSMPSSLCRAQTIKHLLPLLLHRHIKSPPLLLLQTANQVSSASHRKQVDKPNTTMPSSSVYARLHVVSSWVDEKQNDRIHAVISMPSGMHLLKKAEVASTDSGSHLSVFWHWPQIMLDPVKMFAHSRFHGTIQANHPKVIAFVGETDKIRAAADKR